MVAARTILVRLATSQRLERTARAAPLGERLAWRAASRYVAGTTADAAIRAATALHERGVGSSIDLFGESVHDTATADRVTAAYLGLAGRLGATAQANFRRTPRDLERLVAAGVYIRLVKGAYPEPRDRALPYGEPTDVAYLRLAHRLADTGAQFALATHDGVLREALLAALGPRPVEQLLGIRPAVLGELAARGVPVRVYVPYGGNWFRYWMRRLAESRSG